MLALALLLAACTGEPPTPATPLPFDQTGASAVLQLDLLEPRLTLSPGNLPAGAEVPERFELPAVEAVPPIIDDGRSAYIYELPFGTTAAMERFHPPGMQVFVAGEEVPYDISPHAPGHVGWRLKDGQLHVVYRRDRGPLPAILLHPRLGEQVSRLEAPLSGLEPAAFTRFSRTVDDDTRPGLLLPAPSAAEWDVTLPPGAVFRAYPALLAVPLSTGVSDGAELVLSVIDEGSEVEVSRVRVGAARGGWLSRLFSAEDAGEVWQVDLSGHSGRPITVKLASDVLGTPDHDYLFVGTPAVWGTPSAPVRRVVVIGLDTTRPDHLGAHGYARDTSPELDRFAAGAAVFDRAWAPAPRTRPSFRSATTGRGVLDAVGATNIAEVFRAHGFATAGIVANIHLNARFGFHRGFDSWQLDPPARADTQVDRALAWLDAHRDRDSYLFLHLMDPHLFYDAPAPFRDRFVDDADPTVPEAFNRWQVVQWQDEGLLTQRGIATIEGLYDGEIAYTSHQLQRLFDGLDALGGNALVVLHSDHGEELWEHGGFEHNHTLYDEVVRAALWVRPPGGIEGGVRLQEPVTLADIAPTLYDYAGFLDTPPTDGRSLRPLIDGTDPGGWERPLPVGHLMYDVEQWGVVHRDHKYMIVTITGHERLYDLAADPAERWDLAPATDLAPWRQALADAHQMPVGPGWRVDVKLLGHEPLVWTLPEPAVAAGVIDPEASRKVRANLVWGEQPTMLPEEVAEVSLSEDGTTLTVTPGSIGEGTLWVMFGEPVDAGGIVARGEVSMRVETMPHGRGRVRSVNANLVIRPGTVFRPPPSEAARMAGTSDVSDADLELLQSLGYVGGGSP